MVEQVIEMLLLTMTWMETWGALLNRNTQRGGAAASSRTCNGEVWAYNSPSCHPDLCFHPKFIQAKSRDEALTRVWDCSFHYLSKEVSFENWGQNSGTSTRVMCFPKNLSWLSGSSLFLNAHKWSYVCTEIAMYPKLMSPHKSLSFTQNLIIGLKYGNFSMEAPF